MGLVKSKVAEEFKQVEGKPLYLISNLGRVLKGNRQLNPHIDNQGYFIIHLDRKQFRLHRLYR